MVWSRRYKKKEKIIELVKDSIVKKNPDAIIKIMANVLKEYPKGVFLFGTKDAETGTAVALIESKSKIKILDKISVNLYAGKSLTSNNWKSGIGIEKKILKVADIFDVGIGAYVTRNVKDMFSKKTKTNYSIGFSLTGRF